MSANDSATALHAAHALLRDNRIADGLQALTVLANQNIVEAMHDLGLVLLMQATDAPDAAHAVQWLRRAEQAGSADAAYRLAVLSLVDAAEPADWQRLAERLTRACHAGHPDALCDAALFFGRFGTPAQQRASTALLEHAAVRGSIVAMALLGERLAAGRLCDADPARANGIRVLAAQLDLPVPPPDARHGVAAPEPRQAPPPVGELDFTRLPDAAQPPEADTLDARIGLRLAAQALSDEECLYIRCLGGPHLQPSITADPNGGTQRNRIRTSHDFLFLPETETVALRLLQARMAAAAGLPLKQAEAMVLLRYAPGQEYLPHRDYLPPSRFTPVADGGSGQRLRTAIAYLNTPDDGGDTVFPLLERALPARIGHLALFDNLHPDGRLNETSLHAGALVKQGVKWICTLWIRQQAHRTA